MCSFDTKRPFMACLMFSLAMIMVCSTNVPAAAPGWNIIQLTDNDFDDYNIRISGSNVAWTEWDGNINALLLLFYNGSIITQLSYNLSNEDFKISGSNVAWVEDDNGDKSLFFYNGTTTIKLGTNIDEYSFRISGSNVIWIEHDDNGENETRLLLFYDGSTITQLATDIDEEDYKFSGSTVIWKEYDEDNNVTFILIFNGSTTTKWSGVNYIDNFEISGSNAAWVGYNEDEDTFPLCFYNGSTITKLTDHPSNEFFKISGSNIVWLEYYYNTRLFFHNGTTTTMVKDHINNENTADSIRISGSNVVWAEYDDYNDVYSLFIYNGSTVTKLSSDIDYYYDEETYFISGSNVIWVESDDDDDGGDDNEQLFFYNGSTITKLSDHFSSYYDYGSSPISGSIVIWFESEENDEGDWIESLYTFNGSTNAKLSSSSDIYDIRIYGSNVIWKEWDDFNEVYSLFIYNGSTVTKLANVSDDASYGISGPYMVWQERIGDDTDLFFATQLIDLQVTLGPEEAVSAGAQWNVDGGEWQNSGAVVTGLLPGLHTLNYKSIDGWIAPVSESVTIGDNPLINLSRNYAPQPGNIKITLGPADAVSEGVQWNVDGGDWQDSEAVVNDLSVGSHIVNYKSVAGWITPESESVTVNRAATTFLDRTYAPQPGNLHITLFSSEAVSDGAQWNVDGGEWQDSGATVTGLLYGSHTVNYKSIAGWLTPPSEFITINRGATTFWGQYYIPMPGNLQITLGPAEAISDGAQWSVDGGAWQNNGATIMGLSIGSHTINYKSLTGWNAPVSESITINSGETTTFNRNYTIQPGNIQVTLGPAEAVAAGVQWNIDNGGWQNSGAEVSGLSADSHIVDYKSVAGWIAPASESITINKGSTTSVSRIYTPQARGLEINKCSITAGRGVNDNNDIISCFGLTGIKQTELMDADEITVKIGDVYSEPIPVSSFIVKNGKFTYTPKIPKQGTGAITSLVIDTNKHQFSLKARNIDLSGLHCPFDIVFDTGNYRGVSSIYENTANGKKFIPVQLMSGDEDYLQIQSVKVKKGKLSSTLTIKGGIAYKVLPTLISDVVLKLGSQTFIIPSKYLVPSGKSGYKYVCKNVVIPSGIAGATFDFSKCTFIITIKNAKINTTAGKVGLTLSIGSYNRYVNFNLDTGQTVYGKIDGDATGDGIVDFSDFEFFAESWMGSPVMAGLDANGDDFIDFTDFAALANNW